MQIKYKPSKWSKLPYLSKLGLVLFYLSALSGIIGGFFKVFNIKIIKLPDYWLFICLVIAFLGFSIAVIFDKGRNVDTGVLRDID